MITLYNVISSDGYIARNDGSEDFIPDSLWSSTLDFFKRYDALVMGRKTYDAMQKYSEQLLEPFEKLPIEKIVVTGNKNFHPKMGYIVAHSPQDAIALGSNILVSSGPTLNTFFLENKLVNQVIFHQVLDKIDEGIRPFNIDTKNVLLPVSEKVLENRLKEFNFRGPY